MKAIKEMTSKEIVDEFNKITGSVVSRFATRADAERRLEKARADKAAGKFDEDKPSKPSKPKADKKPKAPKVSNRPPKKSAPKDADRSEAIRESWGNAKVAKARSARDGVNVGGNHYRSVREAFEALKLPLSKHIRFRMELKEKRKATFTEGSKSYVFTISNAKA